MAPDTAPNGDQDRITTTAAHITPASDVADPFPRCDGPGCLLRAVTREGRFCAYHQGWFDAMDHIAQLAEAIYDRT